MISDSSLIFCSDSWQQHFNCIHILKGNCALIWFWSELPSDLISISAVDHLLPRSSNVSSHASIGGNYSSFLFREFRWCKAHQINHKPFCLPLFYFGCSLPFTYYHLDFITIQEWIFVKEDSRRQRAFYSPLFNSNY